MKLHHDVDLSVWVGRLDDDELGSLLVAQQALGVFSGMPLARHITHICEEDASGLIGNKRSALREEITQLVSFHPEGAGSSPYRGDNSARYHRAPPAPVSRRKSHFTPLTHSLPVL